MIPFFNKKYRKYKLTLFQMHLEELTWKLAILDKISDEIKGQKKTTSEKALKGSWNCFLVRKR